MFHIHTYWLEAFLEEIPRGSVTSRASRIAWLFLRTLRALRAPVTGECSDTRLCLCAFASVVWRFECTSPPWCIYDDLANRINSLCSSSSTYLYRHIFFCWTVFRLRFSTQPISLKNILIGQRFTLLQASAQGPKSHGELQLENNNSGLQCVQPWFLYSTCLHPSG